LPKFSGLVRKLLEDGKGEDFRIGSRNCSSIIDAIHDDLVKMGVL